VNIKYVIANINSQDSLSFTLGMDSPSFVTEDSCCLLGTLIVELTTEDTTREQIINVSFHYCGTELEVAARDANINSQDSLSFTLGMDSFLKIFVDHNAVCKFTNS
jgi:hypothetical protein